MAREESTAEFAALAGQEEEMRSDQLVRPARPRPARGVVRGALERAAAA
jgi:hypothetical protein